ncbi:MAG: ABC transporter ATP-binding protein [Tissierellia bacterium]|nr:ABC transporter ATP-binding protein [Tissierellia bacterium]
MYYDYLKKYIDKYKVKYIISITIIFLETLVDIVNPALMSQIVDVGVKNRDLNYVLKFGSIMLMITAAGAVFAVIRNIISSRVSQSFAADLREDLYIKIQSLSFENTDNFQEASLITRLTNDVNQVQNFAHATMRIFVKSPIRLIGAIIMALVLDLKMGLIIVGSIPLVVIIIILNLKVSYPLFKNMQRALDKVNAVMREYLAGIRVVKAFNRFNYERKRFKGVNEGLKNETIKATRTVALFNPLVGFIVNIGIVLILWIGGIRVNIGNLQVGKIMALVNYMSLVLFSLGMMTRVLNMYIRAKTSAERIGEVFIEENTILENPKPISLRDVKGRLEFNRVYFKYKESSKYILEDISFTVEAGETLAIIGSTGSGKTSLVNLIPRFYDVNKGQIKLDGVDIKRIALKELRDKIALVPQKPLLFTGTIIDNIKWGNEYASFEEVVEVCKIAQCHDFISSFNDGYNTFLGQGGVNLSGGQKQRISIARALIKKPKILILDDCTSAVDLITERKIKEGLKENLKDTTTILIAQKITSVMDADKILVIDNGRLAGFGNHDMLLRACEVYQDIYRSQIGEGVVDNGSKK